ncbi:MAG: hypothetical protein SFX73_38690 [Kofleriaceae bacterium]|nr:hypothetical protein [Kofleriaceae bacterium]
MRRLVAAMPILFAACPKPPPPPGSNEPPRLPAVEACAAEVELVATPLPVPARPPADPYALPTAATMVAHSNTGVHAATTICDLPDRILALAAEQGVMNGKRRLGGTIYTIPRTAPTAAPVAIEASSPGCVAGAPTCVWNTSSLDTIETIPRQRVSTSGWVHGLEDMCRALPDDTIATCSTANRLAYVELGCQPADAPPVALQLGIHDASLERRYDLDVEVPIARLYGAAETASEPTFVYRFTGPGDAQGHFRVAALSFDLGAKTAVLELDGVREPCLAYGLYRR